MNRISYTSRGDKMYGKILVVDFDGCITEHLGWQGPNTFHPLIPNAAETLRKLRADDWYICIFTARLVTEALLSFLFKNCIPFDDINGRTVMPPSFIRTQNYTDKQVDYKGYAECYYWKHNPDYSSIKPVASVYIDDMNWEQKGKPFTAKTWNKIYKSLKKRFG